MVHNAYGYGLFTGGLGFHYGAERLGATVIPVSGGNTKRQVMLMRDFGSTVLCCTPSYSLLIAEVAEEDGIDLKSLPLKVGLFGAEPWSERMREEIESRLGIVALNVYGLSEVIGPGRLRRVHREARACTSSRITSFPRSSTPVPTNACRTAKWENWS